MNIDVLQLLEDAAAGNSLIDRIIKNNRRTIIAAFRSAFTASGILSCFLNIQLSVDLITIYNDQPRAIELIKYPEAIKEQMNNIIEKTLVRILQCMGYRGLESINIHDFFSLHLEILGLPFVWKNKGLSLAHSARDWKCSKGLIGFVGLVHPTGAVEANKYFIYHCKNSDCFQDKYFFDFNGRYYVLNGSTLHFRQAVGDSKALAFICEACKTKIGALYSSVVYEHAYTISTGSSFIRAISKIDLDINEYASKYAVIGTLRRDRSGLIVLYALSFSPVAQVHPQTYFTAPVMSIKKFALLFGRVFYPYKIEVDLSDFILFVILNSFNQVEPEPFLDSPDSKDQRRKACLGSESPAEAEYNSLIRAVSPLTCYLKTHKLLIYTNDVDLVKTTAKNMTDISISYALSALKGPGPVVCIREINSKINNKAASKADCIFVISLVSSCLYLRKPVTYYRFKPIPIRQTASLVDCLKDVYLYARKAYKGTIEPYRLFVATSLIVNSLFSILGDQFNKEDIAKLAKNHFTDKLLPIGKY